MRKISLSILVSVCCLLPSLVHAQQEPEKHNWVLGYNYETGISLHRIFNENWELFFGGTPTDYNETSHYTENENLPDGSVILVRDRTEVDKTTGGHIKLGMGYTFLREDRFWMAALVGLRHNWTEYDDIDTFQYRDEVGVATRGNVGHSNRSFVFIGIRPAYNISSRIIFSIEFGVNFYHYSYTYDEWAEDPDDVAYWDNSTTRWSSSSDRVELYGYNTINSINIMFRF